MKTSKFLFAVGAAVAVILPLQVQAGPDSEDQAKMRAALRQKMEELNAPKAETPAASAAEPAPPPPPAPIAAPAPKPQPAPVAPAAVVAPQTKVVPVPPPVAPAKVEVPEQPEAAVAPPAADPNDEIMREALRKKIAELQSAPTPVTPTVTGANPAIAPVAAASFTPIVPPASPLSGPKEARLADLLARYKADSITALEYHTQRAAIIAAP